MKKMYWKNIFVPALLASLAVMVGCQSGLKPVPAVSDAPPGVDAGDNDRIVVSMGAVSLGKKQVLNYLQSLDEQVVTRALDQDGGLEALVKGVVLRTNMVTRAAGQNWQERAKVKTSIEEAQRNVLYNMYITEKSEPPADYPDPATVTRFYVANQQQRTADGTPQLKPLWEITPVIKQQLREKQRQVNEQNYLNDLISRNPVSVDLKKLVEYLNLPQEQKQQQGAQLSKHTVARMGNLGVSLGVAVMSLASLEPLQQQQVLSNTQQLQQYMNRLAVQYFVVNEAIAEKFNARPEVNNHMEQARLQVIYTTYLKALTAPESGFPNAALVEGNYQKNRDKLLTPDRYRLAKIVLLNSGDAAADGDKVRQIARSARAADGDFGALARHYSQDPQSAKNRGHVGWSEIQALPPELGQLVRGKPPGTVVGPVQHDWGWQIIKILDHQPGRRQTLEEARPALVTALRKKLRAAKEKQILEQLMASEPVRIDRDALKQLHQEISG